MIHIIADTTCGVPLAVLEAAGISYVPQIITFNHTAYRDDYEITTESFLQKLSESKDLPGTAAPPPALYHPIFEEHLSKGETLLVIAPSQKMSGTYRSALVAAAEFNSDQIHVVDTETIAGGLGSIVLQAKALADGGMEIEALKAYIRNMAQRERAYFLVPTLEYLFKGGRIGRASRLIGTLLQIKPILTIRDGEVDTFDKVRTYKQAIANIEELIIAICQNNPQAHLSISQCGAEAEAQRLAERFQSILNGIAIPIFTVPPAIVVHTGPGLITASAFIAEDVPAAPSA